MLFPKKKKKNHNFVIILFVSIHCFFRSSLSRLLFFLKLLFFILFSFVLSDDALLLHLLQHLDFAFICAFKLFFFICLWFEWNCIANLGVWTSKTRVIFTPNNKLCADFCRWDSSYMPILFAIVVYHIALLFYNIHIKIYNVIDHIKHLK